MCFIVLMADHIIQIAKAKIEALNNNSIPTCAHRSIINGACYFENATGVKLSEYWNLREFDNRDEFFVVLNSYFGLIGILNEVPHKNEWRLKFDVAYLFQLKPNAQSALALNLLTDRNCYADAYSVCRTMISRLNLTVLFAFNPELFDGWLKSPNDDKFKDGNVRKELHKVGMSTVPHLYRLTSEVIHNQFMGLADVGYFEQGLFPNLPGVKNEIWVIAKFVIGMTYNTILSMGLQDCEGDIIPERLEAHKEFLTWLKKNYFVNNRIDHVWTFIPEDRHRSKSNSYENKFMSCYDFDEVTKQIQLFHSKVIRSR